MNANLLWSDERIEQRAEQCIDDIAEHSITDTPRWVEQALKEMRDEYQARITALEQAAPVDAMEMPWAALAQVMEFVDGYVGECLAPDEVEFATDKVNEWLEKQRPATAAGEKEAERDEVREWWIAAVAERDNYREAMTNLAEEGMLLIAERDNLRQQLADCRSLYASLRTEADMLLAERDKAEAQIARGYAPMAQGKEFYTELNKRVEEMGATDE